MTLRVLEVITYPQRGFVHGFMPVGRGALATFHLPLPPDVQLHHLLLCSPPTSFIPPMDVPARSTWPCRSPTHTNLFFKKGDLSKIILERNPSFGITVNLESPSRSLSSSSWIGQFPNPAARSSFFSVHLVTKGEEKYFLWKKLENVFL